MKTTTTKKRVVAGCVLSLSATLALASCSSNSGNSQQAQAPNLNAQPQLSVPNVQNAAMIVPPAPAVPELPKGGDDKPSVTVVPDQNSPAPTGPGNDLYPAPKNENVGEKRGNGQPITKGGVTNAFVTKLTGSQSADHTDTKWGVAGAGNAVMWDNGSGQVITMFGDTFGTPRPKGESSGQPPYVSGAGLNLPIMPKEIPFPALPYVNLKQGGKQGSGYAGDTGTSAPTGFDWRVNTLAYSSTRNLNQMSYNSFLSNRANHAREVIPARRVNGSEITTLPTSGISIGGKQYVSYASIRRYGPAPGSWTSNYSGIAVSGDNGATWRKSGSAFWTNAGPARNFQMPALAKRGGMVYMFGTEQGRVGGVYVARVPANQIMYRAAYQYWTGTHWQKGLTAEPRAVVSGGVGEVSVQYSPSLRRWLMLSTDVFNNGIVLRQAANPQGPWTSPQVVASAANYPSIYGASIHPWSKGNDLYFTMSQWSSYNVYLMHATVTRRGIPAPSPTVPEIPLPGGARIPFGPAPDLGAPKLPTLQLPDSMQGPGSGRNAPRGPGG
ncbi:hypothetical protein GOEFS_039_00390 [Gordonia effusa NBRC 100432]|uniref:DUF4185 domain-containing protein n=1 Tax=Gordonia effusa NBRC 100432 TaxID=1077974 RepID=H0QYA4_9ACTN|nr:DUF4185 domain-containing protein [Gordonia effusa]GAB17805.1 hypothetical protein GOEFS_039_00390 [Gordonia effusa NBRC 100432]